MPRKIKKKKQTKVAKKIKKNKKPKPRVKLFVGHKKEKAKDPPPKDSATRLHPDTKKSVWAIVFLGIAALLFLAGFQKVGAVGGFLYNLFNALFGWGYYLLPLVFLIMAGVFLSSERRRIYQITFIGAGLFVLSGLGLMDIIFPEKGGFIGKLVGSLETPFGSTGSIVILIIVAVISLIITLNLPLRIRRAEEEEEEFEPLKVSGVEARTEAKPEEKTKAQEKVEKMKEAIAGKPAATLKAQTFKLKARGYIAPPLDLLRSSIEKPTSGDLQANANIIKKTLESFGIPVEMGEINIGPKVTRYTLKPAEGVKLSRITALNSDLALALAAHPIRIEAPIPGKALVGIEVPNKAAAVVRLGSLMSYPEFVASGLLGFCLGRDVSGEPLFADIEKMPHLLIAGSTGAGKTCAADTYIFSEKGILTFKEICPLPLNSEKSFRIKIATRDGIEETSKNYNNGMCDFYKIQTAEGYAIEVTAEHPLWILDEGGEMEWRSGADIRINDYVAIDRGAKIFGEDVKLNFIPSKNKTSKSRNIKIPEKMSPNLGLFLGLLTADGGITIKNRVVYTQVNQYLLNLYQALLKDLFSISAPAVNKSGYSNKAKDILVNSKQLQEFLIYLGMKSVKAPQKEIPLFIRMSSAETIKMFLRGLMRNDGHLSQNTLQLCVASKELVKQIQLVLLNFGIISSIHPKKVKNYPERTYWRLSIYGDELVRYSKIIGFLTKEERIKIKTHLSLVRNPNKDIIPNVDSLLKKLKLIYRNSFAKFTHYGWNYKEDILIPKYAFGYLISYNRGERKPSYNMASKILKFYRPISDTAEYQQLEKIRNRNFYWAKVKSITKTAGEGYDFEVPGSNSFVGNGFVNHNSIALHSLIVSLLYKNSPDTLKFILIDPKRVELSVYEGLPHIIGKVITESKKSMAVFRWAINEMERRYELLLQNGSRDIVGYNKKHPDEPLFYLLIVIDELADMMASYGREVEGYIVRLAQMARATGLHLIVSTQRPSVEVVTGLIKANITSRVALQLPSQVDSRTILDTAGAEKLLGGGDMLYVSAKISKPKRIQGAYLSEEEISRVVDFIKRHNKNLIEEEAVSFGEIGEGLRGPAAFDEYLGAGDDDELLEEAIKVVTEAKKASASLLQRRLKVGYARAARLLDIMEAKGIIGPGEGAKPREVYEKFHEQQL
jgi:intein/homing endonuclease